MKKLVISIVLVNLLVACASQKPKEAEKPAAAPAPAPVVEQQAAPEPAPAPVVEVDPLNDPANILSKRSVYYAFDKDVIQDTYKPMVQAHGQYLAEHPDRHVRLEGNADERGSNEYNLGLGQRRANSVKKMLVLSGAKSSQIETVSFGEEKPRCTDHKESCWWQNRRSDIKY